MVYKLVVTQKAEELLDKLVGYLINNLRNEQAATHLFTMIEQVYNNLETDPYLYKVSDDPFLNRLGYREAIVPGMNYMMVFEIEDDTVTILGFFHQLENYRRKLSD